jgi:hypothetical protein
VAKLIKIKEALYKYNDYDDLIIYGSKNIYINPDKIIDVVPASSDERAWLIKLEGEDRDHYVTGDEWARIELLLVEAAPLTREEQWAKWDAEDKDQKYSARVEMSHYIPEMNPADPFPPATPAPAPVLPENVIKAWKEFEEASIDYELRDEPEEDDLLEKFKYTRSMFLTHFGDYMDEMRRKNAPTDPIEPTHFAF